jgi:hypothetical protein
VPAITAALLGSVEPSRSGVASGTLNTARQTGSVLGVSVFGALTTVGLVPALRLAATISVALATTCTSWPLPSTRTRLDVLTRWIVDAVDGCVAADAEVWSGCGRVPAVPGSISPAGGESGGVPVEQAEAAAFAAMLTAVVRAEALDDDGRDVEEGVVTESDGLGGSSVGRISEGRGSRLRVVCACRPAAARCAVTSAGVRR